MQTIRARLSLNHLIVLALGMTLAGALAWLAVEGLYIDTQRENLLAQARLIAAALEGSALPTEPVQPYSQTANVAPGVHTRLLSEGGAVVLRLPLSEAFGQAPAAEQSASIPTSELVQRPEIDSALGGTPATAIRRILENRRVLYAAAPVYAENGGISGIVYIATPLPSAGLPVKIILQLVGAVLSAVLLAAFLGGLLARKITRPLEGLAQAATSIAQGNLEQRAAVDSNITELHRLEQTFNHMADNLRQSDEAKKAFIADVTHELRTPLTVLKGTIETLEDGALDDTEGRGLLLTSMERETDRLIRLVNELLVLTRADAGALQLNMLPLDLVELVKARCDHFTPLTTRRGITLNYRADCQSARLVADSDRLSQVLDNILDNAIRHSPEHSTITIALREANGGVECSVSDQGTGIPAQQLPFIFERFYRVDAARDRRDGGTGLGLAIARALIHAQGGNIRAQSVEGQGTTVTFGLPISR
jgi:two-component system, OmpR family, sensor histidine kinase BaeS